MLQPGGDFDLAEEALGPEGRGQLRPQHFDRHLAVMPQVLGQVHRRHPAMTQLPHDGVAVGERFLQAGERFVHCGDRRWGRGKDAAALVDRLVGERGISGNPRLKPRLRSGT